MADFSEKLRADHGPGDSQPPSQGDGNANLPPKPRLTPLERARLACQPKPGGGVRYNHPELVKLDDPRFMDIGSEDKRRNSKKEPSTDPEAIALRELTNRARLLLEHVEDLARQWLSKNGLVLVEERGLIYDEKRGPAPYYRRAREIDAVSSYQLRPDIFFEIKASPGYQVMTQGRNQLRESRAIIQRLLPDIGLCLVAIDTSGERAIRTHLPILNNGPDFDPQELRVAARREEIPMLILTLTELNEFGKSHNQGLSTEEIDFIHARASRRHYRT